MKQLGQNEESCYLYALETFKPLDPALLKIVEGARNNNVPEIQVGPMDGQSLQIIVKATGAKKVVEIGTLVGYSTVCLARGLPKDGRIWTFEFEEKHARIAELNLRENGFQDKVQVIVGPALDNLARIEHQGPFDLVFIDADKTNYSNYLKWAISNIRSGGSILADNTFAWGDIGKSVDTEKQPLVQSLRDYNQLACNHPKLRTTILPTYEGLTWSVKI